MSRRFSVSQNRTSGDERFRSLRLLTGAAAEVTGLFDFTCVMAGLAFHPAVVASATALDAIHFDLAVRPALAARASLEALDVEIHTAGLKQPIHEQKGDTGE